MDTNASYTGQFLYDMLFERRTQWLNRSRQRTQGVWAGSRIWNQFV